jgi:hypothetical protein
LLGRQCKCIRIYLERCCSDGEEIDSRLPNTKVIVKEQWQETSRSLFRNHDEAPPQKLDIQRRAVPRGAINSMGLLQQDGVILGKEMQAMNDGYLP